MINREALQCREIMYLVASVCLPVRRRLSVSPAELLQLNRLTYDLDFCIGVDLDYSWKPIVGQGRRSKVKVKCKKLCF